MDIIQIKLWSISKLCIFEEERVMKVELTITF